MAVNNAVYMDIPGVQSMADKFRMMGDLLLSVGRALEAAATVLKVTAFAGRVGGTALLHYIEEIKPKVDWLGQKFQEINADLLSAIVSYRDGDTQGSRRFCN